MEPVPVIRSKREEIEAIREIRRRADVGVMPNVRRDLAKAGVPITVADGYKVWDGSKDSEAICMLYRGGRTIFSDNKLGRCERCREIIQWRPTLPDWLVKVCAFCALRRARGDA